VAPESKTAQINVLQDNSYRGTIFHSTALVSSGVIQGLSVSLSDVFAM
jgi:hypothetical protein